MPECQFLYGYVLAFWLLQLDACYIYGSDDRYWFLEYSFIHLALGGKEKKEIVMEMFQASTLQLKDMNMAKMIIEDM